MNRDLTPAEERAIAALRRLAKRWPKSLMLFSNSGSLEVHLSAEFHSSPGGIGSEHVTIITGIANSGDRHGVAHGVARGLGTSGE